MNIVDFFKRETVSVEEFKTLIQYTEYLADRMEALRADAEKREKKIDYMLKQLHPELKNRKNFIDLFYGDEGTTRDIAEELH